MSPYLQSSLGILDIPRFPDGAYQPPHEAIFPLVVTASVARTSWHYGRLLERSALTLGPVQHSGSFGVGRDVLLAAADQVFNRGDIGNPQPAFPIPVVSASVSGEAYLIHPRSRLLEQWAAQEWLAALRNPELYFRFVRMEPEGSGFRAVEEKLNLNAGEQDDRTLLRQALLNDRLRPFVEEVFRRDPSLVDLNFLAKLVDEEVYPGSKHASARSFAAQYLLKAPMDVATAESILSTMTLDSSPLVQRHALAGLEKFPNISADISEAVLATSLQSRAFGVRLKAVRILLGNPAYATPGVLAVGFGSRDAYVRTELRPLLKTPQGRDSALRLLRRFPTSAQTNAARAVREASAVLGHALPETMSAEEIFEAIGRAFLSADSVVRERGARAAAANAARLPEESILAEEAAKHRRTLRSRVARWAFPAMHYTGSWCMARIQALGQSMRDATN